jgi:hypothetical protein
MLTKSNPSDGSTIDITDTQWQVDEKYNPDKEDTWGYPATKDGWMHAHNAIRGELNDLSEAIKSVATKYPNGTPSWAIDSIKTLWNAHEIFIHAHHGNEDIIMTPFLMTRIKLPDKLESDHKIVVDIMNDVKQSIDDLKENDSLHLVLERLTSYQEALFPHLMEEENIALPLMRSYFTPKEVKPKVMEILSLEPSIAMGSFIYFMTEEVMRSDFMKQEGIPFFVWYIAFKKNYNKYLTGVRTHIDALNNGIPRVAKKSGMIC